MIKVGNRRKLSLWMDNWIGNRPLKVLFPDLFTLASNAASTLAENRVNGFGVSTSEELLMIGK